MDILVIIFSKKRYQSFKQDGRLDLSSEETIRTWINELLSIFDWDTWRKEKKGEEKSKRFD